MSKAFVSALPRRASGLGAGIVLVGSLLCVLPPSAQAGGGGYVTYGDPHLGYALDRPTGWNVHADSHSVLVQSPDHTQSAFVETFDAPPGQSAAERLQQPTDKETALFPDATLRLLPSGDGQAQAAGSLAFSGKAGQEQGRVLCRIAGAKGLIFAIAAPSDRFLQAEPVLMHVVKSLRFLPTTRGGGGGATSAFNVGAIKRSLHFVTWTEPKEHAFHLQVPQGWKMEGGAFRYGVTDMRMAYQATSPGKDIAIVFGDQSLPTFEVPTPITEQLGERELQPINESPTFHPVLLHYMAATEFNHWYLEQAMSHLVEGLQITGDKEAPGPTGQPGVSIAMTEFTGRNKATGKKLHGLLNSVTSRNSPDAPNWRADPEMVICDDDASLPTRFKKALVVYLQMKFSYSENGAWIARRRQEIFEATGRQLALTAQISHQTAIDSDAKENAIMGAFQGRSTSQDMQQNGFADYIGDKQDVTGADGTRYKVTSGEKYHYQDSSGTILSTNSAYSPGVDWTLMTEH